MVGFFDSGVGGLSVLREFQQQYPHEDIVYYGDTAHAPYGPRTVEEITALSLRAVDVLIQHGAQLIVVACNTATSVAIQELRRQHTEVPIIGVVPVLKTLAQRSRNKRVAVCATAATLSSRSYQTLQRTFANNLNVLELALPEWVTFVESGDVAGSSVRTSIASTAKKIRDFDADSVAFGCTHFTFLRPLMEHELPECSIYDSGAAVARHIGRVLTANRMLARSSTYGTERFFSSGDVKIFSMVASQLLDRAIVVTE